MIADRYIKWKISKNPGAYSVLHYNLTASRMGVTLQHYLYYALSLSFVLGVLLGLLGYFISATFIIPNFSIRIYDVFNIQVSSYSELTFLSSVAGFISFLVCFIAGSAIGYYTALKYPEMQKSARATKINLSIHNAVSYMYAMRRGGAELLEIFESISDNSGIYGEIALELRLVIRDTEYFGLDLISALRNLTYTTPSEKFKDFLEDLLSVLNSGGDVSSYLEGRVRLYQDEARFEQKQFLSVLQIIAESYVTVFVAGPLFLIIIMVVMGMVGRTAVIQFTAVTYVVLPIGAVVFMLFIDLISLKDEQIEKYLQATVLNQFNDITVVKKKSDSENLALLDSYDRKKKFMDFLKSPTKWFTTDPKRSLIISAPVAAAYAILIYLSIPYYSNSEITIDVIDDHLIIAILMVIIPYAIFYEIWRKKVRNIEEGTPDFLDRLGGINRVGMTLADAITILVRANLGVISYEVRRIKRDIEWGANVRDALIRFEKRINTAAIARTVTLITKASEMSGEIGEVLSIASSDARMSQTLKHERSGEMFIYTMIIYLAFFVFVFVVAVLDVNFLSILSTVGTSSATQATDLAQGSSYLQSTQVPVDTFKRLLYHTCMIQAFFSGLIAGQMGEGSLKAGVKHVAVMLIAGLIIFNTVI
ncbi:flagellar protein FlaJ [Methanomicrobium sp. W14]|uniref:type II secretion system F family protein n=1 Tax=Methanomicrobium sp. W14 TaxID=2817839 RepID=UPI001AE0FF29|nr:type II secretion system F family protein [Methanomicrobium sp. W14]MBP2133595.1 flagellar protein FlaJ [Methanomicrobium sp. W14]